MKNPPRLTALLPLMALLILGVAFAADPPTGGTVTAQQPVEGLMNFVDFAKIIPSMDDLLKTVMGIMVAMDVPGVADTIARLVAGVIAVTTFAIAWLNYGLGRRLSIAGIDGSYNNMIMAAMTILLISTGAPRLAGEAGWALWRLTYTTVESKTHDTMDKLITDRTGQLATAVWQYGAAGLSSGFQPTLTAGRFLSGNIDGNRAGAAGESVRQANEARIKEIKDKNAQYSGMWQIGALLIASMYMGYIGVILGSGLFVLFSAIFLPVAFAFFPINSGLTLRMFGGMASSTLVAGVAPGLMMANVTIVFDGPINYIIRMLRNMSATAETNANLMQTLVHGCTSALGANAPTAIQNPIAAGVGKVLNGTATGLCTMGAQQIVGSYTLGQAALYTIIGLVVTGMLFVGLSGLAMMIFREFKIVVDTVMGGMGGSVGNGGNGKGMAFASGAMNRLAGAAMVAGGLATGNAAVTKAGAQTVASGKNALGSAIGAADETRKVADAKKQAELKEQLQKDRDANQLAQRLADRDENRQYSENLYNERQKAQEEKRNGSKEQGEGSKTDPRSTTSGPKENQPNGGAVNSNPNERKDSDPASPESTNPDDDDDDGPKPPPPPPGGGTPPVSNADLESQYSQPKGSTEPTTTPPTTPPPAAPTPDAPKAAATSADSTQAPAATAQVPTSVPVQAETVAVPVGTQASEAQPVESEPVESAPIDQDRIPDSVYDQEAERDYEADYDAQDYDDYGSEQYASESFEAPALEGEAIQQAEAVAEAPSEPTSSEQEVKQPEQSEAVAPVAAAAVAAQVAPSADSEPPQVSQPEIQGEAPVSQLASERSEAQPSAETQAATTQATAAPAQAAEPTTTQKAPVAEPKEPSSPIANEQLESQYAAVAQGGVTTQPAHTTQTVTPTASVQNANPSTTTPPTATPTPVAAPVSPTPVTVAANIPTKTAIPAPTSVAPTSNSDLEAKYAATAQQEVNTQTAPPVAPTQAPVASSATQQVQTNQATAPAPTAPVQPTQVSEVQAPAPAMTAPVSNANLESQYAQEREAVQPQSVQAAQPTQVSTPTQAPSSIDTSVSQSSYSAPVETAQPVSQEQSYQAPSQQQVSPEPTTAPQAVAAAPTVNRTMSNADLETSYAQPQHGQAQTFQADQPQQPQVAPQQQAPAPTPQVPVSEPMAQAQPVAQHNQVAAPQTAPPVAPTPRSNTDLEAQYSQYGEGQQTKKS